MNTKKKIFFNSKLNKIVKRKEKKQKNKKEVVIILNFQVILMI